MAQWKEGGGGEGGWETPTGRMPRRNEARASAGSAPVYGGVTPSRARGLVQPGREWARKGRRKVVCS